MCIGWDRTSQQRWRGGGGGEEGGAEGGCLDASSIS